MAASPTSETKAYLQGEADGFAGRKCNPPALCEDSVLVAYQEGFFDGEAARPHI